MSSEVLVPRPQLDSRTMVQTEKEPASEPEPLHRSAGEATAGYRSAKYTPAEWHDNNYAILYRAVTDCDEAHRVQQRSKSLCKDTEAGTQRAQADGTRLLGERLHDLHFWKSELQRHIEKLTGETELLLAQKTRLEKALDATYVPYAISVDNQTCRERRPAPDLVKDCVEDELHKEVDLIKNVQALLRRTLAQVTEQIRKNREVKLALEMDWSDKSLAYSLDNMCGRYNNLSTDTQHYPSSASIQDQVSNRESWMSFTQNNLTSSAREQQTSLDLRVLVERVLQEVSEDLRSQCSVVDQAFKQRCMEISEAKTQLELHLAQVLQQIAVQERNISSLQEAIHDKEAPQRVAQSRLYVRAGRANMELCRDGPQLSLVQEVGELDAIRASLKQELTEAQDSLQRLEESRLALERDIACKSHALLIDRDKCLLHRRHYPPILTLCGY